MKQTQALPSGLTLRQDFSDSVRAVFFQTEYEEFLYATGGGTLFLVRYRGRLYGLTCAHVFQDFPRGNLFVTADKIGQKGSMPAPIKGLSYPSSPWDAAVGTDVVDLCAIEFADDIPTDFFKDSPYIINETTVRTSELGHELHVAGVLKEKCNITPPDICMGYCRLQLRDSGPTTFDPFLRHATATFWNPSFSSVTGISGAPVFDHTANALCGMVVRGGMSGTTCTIYYVDISDIVRFLEGVYAHLPSACYTKYLSFPVPARRVAPDAP